ncbi:hypothetical protein BN946_scf185008.g116 [Trametes cinnabarina]|uniref:RING-type domain-containing protein n=1 Tax=Pycnoporus cinnabarinus TaxID=5643 RepID=A0A060SLQ6_PYCCI|nr:hypothetical protein BN946_scf185008.g116 [Trametes cinnabarina]
MRGVRPILSSPTSSKTAPSLPSLSPASSSRGRRSFATPVVPRRTTLGSSSPSTTCVSLKRDVDVLEETPSRLTKRRRSSAKDDASDSLANRLKDTEKILHRRELELKKREAAVVKKQNALQRKEESLSRERESLLKRKETLLAKARDVESQARDLSARGRALLAQEKALAKQAEAQATAAAVISAHPAVDPLWALSHLEDHFTCSLCFEVMACPYSLNPGRCGHSFCALCILKWCFAAVHRGCGYWHDPLECPLCRAELFYTSDVTPRSPFSFPFVPNRLADGEIQALIEVVRSVKPEPTTGVCMLSGVGGSEHKPGAKNTSPDTDRLLAWHDHGMLYEDWIARDSSFRRGRAEMTLLVNEWSTLDADDFIAFKDRLAV